MQIPSLLLMIDKDYDGGLNFATDAWTSPNNKDFVAITVHFEVDGASVFLLLDIVELAVSHSNQNLAIAFTSILDDYGISDKVSVNAESDELDHSTL